MNYSVGQIYLKQEETAQTFLYNLHLPPKLQKHHSLRRFSYSLYHLASLYF